MLDWKIFFRLQGSTQAKNTLHIRGKGSDAAAWGRYVANCVYQRRGNHLPSILSAWQWQLIVASEDHPFFPLSRVAVWEGDTKTIRLFLAPLQRAFPRQERAPALACAHEMFHGLVSGGYYNMLPYHLAPPSLSSQDEEIAAQAFAREFVENFHLTLET